ncbi:MAG: isochorismatase family protein [Nanoarchaeota archaeon]
MALDEVIKSSAEPPRDLGVLLIDMQPTFLEKLDLYKSRQMINYQSKVLDYCVEQDLPVFVLEFLGCGKTIRSLSRKMSPLKRIKKITKRNDDGFKKTSLAADLSVEGIRTVMLMGVYASYCIRDTAIGAIDNGFDITTSRMLIADPFSLEHEFKESIKWYKEYGQYNDNYAKLLKGNN